MIMKKLIRTLLCCLLFLLSTGMYAQKGLQIASVFQKYGNEKGATYVELSKMLSKTWDITHYQSLKLSVKDQTNRFILFRLGKKGEATLIYIEGEIDSDDLVTLIFSKD